MSRLAEIIGRAGSPLPAVQRARSDPPYPGRVGYFLPAAAVAHTKNVVYGIMRPAVVAFCLLLLGLVQAFADGIVQADSPDFTLDTTGVPSGIRSEERKNGVE